MKRNRYRTKKVPPSLASSIMLAIIDNAIASNIVEELKQLWAARKAGEPVAHVFDHKLQQAVLYCTRNEGACAVVAYTLATQFMQEATAMQWKAGLE